MGQNPLGQTHAVESVSGALILQLEENGVSYPFIEVLRKMEKISIPFGRFYKEENLEEIQAMEYLQAIVASVPTPREQGQPQTAFVFDDIWLRKNQAILLGLLVYMFVTDSLKNCIGNNAPEIEIRCCFSYGKLEFSYAHLNTDKPLHNVQSPENLALTESVIKILRAQGGLDLNYHGKFNLIF